MSDRQTFLSSWRERLSALRNVPPVLKIVWESGRGVVLFGILARVLAALLPLALTYVAKLIIDIVANATKDSGRSNPALVVGADRVQPGRAG